MKYNDYNEFINYLYTLQDLKYKEFHSKLIMDDNLIGIRTPLLKKIAKDISKSNYKKFIKDNKHSIYEEKLIHGLLLGYIKTDINDLKPLLEEFLPFIDNWAICDLTASNLKIFKNNKDGYSLAKKYIKNKNYWIKRFGYVLILDYYIDYDNLDEIFSLCEIESNEYYVKMAIAWLISICYIKYSDKTLEFLKNNKLDTWTYNKAISKIIESNRVDKKNKEYLKGLKK